MQRGILTDNNKIQKISGPSQLINRHGAHLLHFEMILEKLITKERIENNCCYSRQIGAIGVRRFHTACLFDLEN